MGGGATCGGRSVSGGRGQGTGDQMGGGSSAPGVRLGGVDVGGTDPDGGFEEAVDVDGAHGWPRFCFWPVGPHAKTRNEPQKLLQRTAR